MFDYFKPDATIAEPVNLNDGLMAELNISALIFDLDDTLVREHTGSFTQGILDSLKNLHHNNIKIGILTNNMSYRYCRHVVDQLSTHNIKVILLHNAFKPLPVNFKKIANLLQVPADKVAIVGDGILTDCLGARFANMKFISVTWFADGFFRLAGLFLFREFIVILSDWVRFVLLGHRSFILESDYLEEQKACPKKYFFLVNPYSSRTHLEEFNACLENAQQLYGFNYDVHVISDFKACFTELGKTLKEGNYTHLVAVGGDGTVRIAINLAARFNRNLAVGIVPTGTGNLLAKVLGISLDLQTAINEMLLAIPKSFSITRVNDTNYAALVIGIGFDAEVMHQTTSRWKKIFGPLAYIFSWIRTVLVKNKAVYFLEIDGKQLVRKAEGVLLIHRNVFARAFLPVSPPSDSEDTLDVCILKARNRLSAVEIAEKILWGTYESTDLIEYYRAKTIRITTWPREKVQVDGDVVTSGTIRARVLPNHILILKPPTETNNG